MEDPQGKTESKAYKKGQHIKSKGKPKRQGKKQFDAVPPLPGSSLYFQSEIAPRCGKYEGVYLDGYAVWIKDTDQAMDLFKCGFYGKGILSRSKPTWSKTKDALAFKDKNNKRDGGFHRKRFSKKQKTSESVDTNNDDNRPERKLESLEEPIERSKEEETSTPEDKDMVEYLQLGLEEAFYLMFAIRCLSIKTEDNTELSIQQCWEHFKQSQPRFLLTYISYHYYRSLNWIPKYGLKYGVDWVLYRKGPSYYHAEKAIIIYAVDAITKESISVENIFQRKMSWLNISNLNRVSEQVKKGLTICYINSPNPLTATAFDNSDPNTLPTQSLSQHLSKFSVSELKVSRWAPNKTREKK